jgi:hypothetical protein
MRCFNNEEKEKCIDDYVDIMTTVANKRVQDAETANTQKQEHMNNVEKA